MVLTASKTGAAGHTDCMYCIYMYPLPQRRGVADHNKGCPLPQRQGVADHNKGCPLPQRQGVADHNKGCPLPQRQGVADHNKGYPLPQIQGMADHNKGCRTFWQTAPPTPRAPASAQHRTCTERNNKSEFYSLREGNKKRINENNCVKNIVPERIFTQLFSFIILRKKTSYRNG